MLILLHLAHDAKYVKYKNKKMSGQKTTRSRDRRMNQKNNYLGASVVLPPNFEHFLADIIFIPLPLHEF